MKTKILVLTVLTLSMIGCKTNQQKAEDEKKVEEVATTDDNNTLKENDSDQKITEKYWKLITLNGEEIVFKEGQRKEAHFILKNKENRVAGNAGCNNIMGTYKLLEGNKIEFSKMATTMMHCEGVKNEHEFLTVFEAVDHYTLKEDALVFQDKDNKVLAAFEAVYLQ